MVYVGGREAATVGEINSTPNKPTSSSAIVELSSAVVVASMEVVVSFAGAVIVMDGVECAMPGVYAAMPLASSAISRISWSTVESGNNWS